MLLEISLDSLIINSPQLIIFILQILVILLQLYDIFEYHACLMAIFFLVSLDYTFQIISIHFYL